jgi:hypothetical protein
MVQISLLDMKFGACNNEMILKMIAIFTALSWKDSRPPSTLKLNPSNPLKPNQHLT